MKNKKRTKKNSRFCDMLEKMDAYNPFLKTLLLWLLAAGATICFLALLRRSGSFGGLIGAAAFVFVAGPASTGLTAAILNFFGYRDYKKSHPGKKTDKQTYIRIKKKAQSDFDERYEAIGNMHRRH